MEARYNARIKDCQTEAELCNYLLDCMSVIREYSQESTSEPQVQTKHVLGIKLASRKGVQRNDIYKKYLMEVENEHIDMGRPTDINCKPCTRCGAEFSWMLDEIQSDRVCTRCGYAEYYLCEEVGFKEEQEMEKNVVYSYKRENHFNEWVSQFQAKETTQIPEEVIEAIRNRIKKERIKDVKLINYDKMREILRKLGLNKYFEHIQYINSLFGIKPPIMNEELHETLCVLFIEIQKPWAVHCPANRTNFFNYTYTLYQLCVLLDQVQYLPYIPMMKDREKQLEQDMIWKKVCNDLDWEFFPTV
jgi:hypothetical protein